MRDELLGNDDVLENVIQCENEISRGAAAHISPWRNSQWKAIEICVVSPSGAKQTSRERLCRPSGALQRCNALDSHGSRRGLVHAAAPRLFQCIPLALLFVLFYIPATTLADEPNVSKQPVPRDLRPDRGNECPFGRRHATCVAVAQRIRRPPGQSEKDSRRGHSARCLDPLGRLRK